MIAHRLIAVGLTLLGIGLAGTGIYLLIAKVRMNTDSWAGWGSIAVSVVGLLLVALAGGLWRAAGGGRVGVHRRTLRGRLGLPYGGKYSRDDD